MKKMHPPPAGVLFRANTGDTERVFFTAAQRRLVQHRGTHF